MLAFACVLLLLTARLEAIPVGRDVLESCVVTAEGRLTGPPDDNFQIGLDGLTVEFSEVSDAVGLNVEFLTCTPNYGGFPNNGTPLATGGGLSPLDLYGHIYIPSYDKCLYVDTLVATTAGGYALQARPCYIINDEGQIGYSWLKYTDNYYWIGDGNVDGQLQDGATCASGWFDYQRVLPPFQGEPVIIVCSDDVDTEPFRIGAANPVL